MIIYPSTVHVITNLQKHNRKIKLSIFRELMKIILVKWHMHSDLQRKYKHQQHIFSSYFHNFIFLLSVGPLKRGERGQHLKLKGRRTISLSFHVQYNKFLSTYLIMRSIWKILFLWMIYVIEEDNILVYLIFIYKCYPTKYKEQNKEL